MSNATAPSSAMAVIAALITPAILILGAASLVASVLGRMARVVDRARTLTTLVHEGNWEKIGASREQMRFWLERHAQRARYAERSIALLYGAVVLFIAACLAIVLDQETGGRLSWLPTSLALLGTVLLLVGATWMVAESRLSGAQIQDEIGRALANMEERAP